MTSYWPAMVVSLIAHGLIIALVMLGWKHQPPSKSYKPPSSVKATLVEMKPKGKEGAKKKPKDSRLEREKQRLAQEQQKKRAQELANKKKLAQQQAARHAEQKKKAARAKALAAQKAKEKALAKQKLKREKLRREELMRQAEAERKTLEAQQFKDNLAQEQKRLEAERKIDALAQQVEEDERLAQSFIELIKERIRLNWSRPPSARNNMETLLIIRLIPTGEVVEVTIAKSSGNAAFDRSAIQAVKKARQFVEIKQMPTRVFEKEGFRQITLMFNPQDLRQ